MKVKRRAVWFVCLLLGACLPGNTDGRKCAGFDFPTLSNNTLTAKENDTISFPFRLNYHNCTTRDFVLTVAKRDQETGRYGYFCKIPHMNGRCHALSQQTGCYCMEEPGSYRFSKTADMADNATWVWMSDGLAEDEEVIFRIISPPEFPLSNTSAFSFDAARDAKLSFQVRTHTAEISDCDLTQLTSSHRSQDCS
ncbi:hypothetical protein BaRGS_00039773, partial [Batillaria attramentaria]